MTDRTRTIAQMLDGLTFPAEKWQVVTQAELYGADAGTCQELRGLPLRAYRDCGEVSRLLDGGLRTRP